MYWEKNAGGGIGAFPAYDKAAYAVRCRPSPFALGAEVFQFLSSRHAPATAPLHMRGIVRWCQNTIRNPALALESGNILDRVHILVECQRVLWAKRKARRRAVARHPLLAVPHVAERVAPPEVVAGIPWLIRADVRGGPVRATFPELDLVVRVRPRAEHRARRKNHPYQFLFHLHSPLYLISR